MIFKYKNYNYFNTHDEGKPFHIMCMNSINGFQEGQYDSVKNVIIQLKNIIKQIDLIENNYTNNYINQLYNFNVLGNQATYFNNEECYNSIYLCLINGYNSPQSSLCDKRKNMFSFYPISVQHLYHQGSCRTDAFE